MAVTTVKSITDELIAILEANLEGVVENVKNGNYEYYVDGGDRVMVILVGPLVFVLARRTSSLSRGEPLTITEKSPMATTVKIAMCWSHRWRMTC